MGPNGIKPATILDFLAKVRESKLQSIQYLPNSHSILSHGP